MVNRVNLHIGQKWARYFITVLLFSATPAFANHQMLKELGETTFKLLYRVSYPGNPLGPQGAVSPQEFDAAYEQFAFIQNYLIERGRYLMAILSQAPTPESEKEEITLIKELGALIPAYFNAQTQYFIAARLANASAWNVEPWMQKLEALKLRFPRRAAISFRQVNPEAIPAGEASSPFHFGNYQTLHYRDEGDVTIVGFSQAGLDALDTRALVAFAHSDENTPEAKRDFLDALKMSLLRQYLDQWDGLGIMENELKSQALIPEPMRRRFFGMHTRGNSVQEARNSKNEALFRRLLVGEIETRMSGKLPEDEMVSLQMNLLSYNAFFLSTAPEVFSQIAMFGLSEETKKKADFQTELSAIFKRAHADVGKFEQEAISNHLREIIEVARKALDLEARMRPRPSRTVMIPGGQMLVESDSPRVDKTDIDPIPALTTLIKVSGMENSVEFAKFLDPMLKELGASEHPAYAAIALEWQSQLQKIFKLKEDSQPFRDWSEDDVRRMALVLFAQEEKGGYDPERGSFPPEVTRRLRERKLESNSPTPKADALAAFFRIGKRLAFDQVTLDDQIVLRVNEGLAKSGLKINAVRIDERLRTKIPSVSAVFSSAHEHRAYYDEILQGDYYKTFPILTDEFNGNRGVDLLAKLDPAKPEAGIAILRQYATRAREQLQKLIQDVAESQSPDALVFKASVPALLSIAQGFPIFRTPISRMILKWEKSTPMDRLIQSRVYPTMFLSMAPMVYKGLRWLFFRNGGLRLVNLFFDCAWMDAFMTATFVAMIPTTIYEGGHLWQNYQIFRSQRASFYTAWRVSSPDYYMQVTAAEKKLFWESATFAFNTAMTSLLALKIPGLINTLATEMKMAKLRLVAEATRDPRLRETLAQLEKVRGRLEEVNRAMVAIGMTKIPLEDLEKVCRAWRRAHQTGSVSTQEFNAAEEAYYLLKAYRDKVMKKAEIDHQVPVSLLFPGLEDGFKAWSTR